MTNTHILGDSGPRKSNFDPDLARKVTKYYEEHPEELEKPLPRIEARSPVSKYILMPETDTYALGLHALQEECVKENNQTHPQFTLPDNSKIYRPLTFKENIHARVEYYETIHNPDGSERTIKERLSLITKRWNDSCAAIAYKDGTTKFKVVLISAHLITLNPDFKEDFLQVDYNTINGTELDQDRGKYNLNLDEKEVQNHEGWLTALEGDGVLLKSYTGIIFEELKRKKDREEGMGFWLRQNPATDAFRALYVDSLTNVSGAIGYSHLGSGGSFLRRSPL